ncbi:hypothetical protein P3T39_006369 [Kitasatospora sp. GP82]|nr:hypothetical protein [Kitasatospora sp. GP82]
MPLDCSGLSAPTVLFPGPGSWTCWAAVPALRTGSGHLS